MHGVDLFPDSLWADTAYIARILSCPHTRIDGQKSQSYTGKERGKTMEEKTKKKGTPPPRYNEAFKAGAVRMVTEQGREPREVARDLGICIDTLRRPWHLH